MTCGLAVSLNSMGEAGLLIIMLLIMQGLDLLSDYDYIAIFDADFKPDSDFLVSCSCFPCSQPLAYGALMLDGGMRLTLHRIGNAASVLYALRRRN